ncbi:MAG TPA: hypothetical protein VFQ36_00595, partial [Ktedonobacteraceae bacterium]|nr:hypothetical protein [Ktedonobacteraceae bacterium]
MNTEQHDKRDIDVKPRLLYTHLSTGDAKYHDIEKMALVEFDITNNSEKSILVSLVSEIEDCSYEKNDPLWLAPGQRLICRQLPRIKDANVHQLDQDRSTQVLTSYIYDGKTYPIKEDLSLTVIPYNEIIWLMPHPTEAGSRISLFHHIVAWVYDDGDKDVKEMQDNVLAELEREKKSPGYPQYLNEYDEENKPRELVRTIFRLLRDSKKISYRYRYDSEGIQRSEIEISQSVKRPGKTLRDEKGNCIDIAVLCANLIITIGLDPIIVIKKNHAFVGWKIYSEDVWNILNADEKLERQEYEFLDTTWSDDCNKNFDEASEAGKNLYDEIL